MPRGVTGIFYDAREIANVLGLKGLRLFLEEARQTPLLAYLQVRSCVPAAGWEWETAGAEMGPQEVAEALSWGDDVIGLGEAMNFPGVILGDPKMEGEIATTVKAGKIVEGHFSWPSRDWRLAAYAAAKRKSRVP